MHLVSHPDHVRPRVLALARHSRCGRASAVCLCGGVVAAGADAGSPMLFSSAARIAFMSSRSVAARHSLFSAGRAATMGQFGCCRYPVLLVHDAAFGSVRRRWQACRSRLQYLMKVLSPHAAFRSFSARIALRAPASIVWPKICGHAVIRTLFYFAFALRSFARDLWRRTNGKGTCSLPKLQSD